MYGIAPKLGISIHSLQVEGDQSRIQGIPREGISIHSLQVEGDSKTIQLQTNIRFCNCTSFTIRFFFITPKPKKEHFLTEKSQELWVRMVRDFMFTYDSH